MNGYTMSESIDRLEKRVQSLESGGGGGTAAGVSYDPTGTSLTSTNVQAAISEVDSNVSDNVADIEALQTEVTNLGLDKQDKLPDPVLGKFLKTITTGLSWESVEANDVEFNNTGTGMESTNVQDALEEVFQSVSDGKEYLAEKITDKGVPTSASDTFIQMGDNVELIPSGGGMDFSTVSDSPGRFLNSNVSSRTFTSSFDGLFVGIAYVNVNAERGVSSLSEDGQPISYLSSDYRNLDNYSANEHYIITIFPVKANSSYTIQYNGNTYFWGKIWHN